MSDTRNMEWFAGMFPQTYKLLYGDAVEEPVQG